MFYFVYIFKIERIQSIDTNTESKTIVKSSFIFTDNIHK
jgi:hypothetical protein